MTDRIAELEALLRRREALNKRNSYFFGASERDPNFSADDERAWDQLVVEMRAASAKLRALAADLRQEQPEAFAEWVEQRRQVHEAELADPAIADWKRKHLTETMERWARFLREDFEDFTRWVSW